MQSISDVIPNDWRKVARRNAQRFGDDNVTLAASGVAYFFFLALVPLIGAAIALYGIAADEASVTSLIDRLGSSVPESTSMFLEEQLNALVSASNGALGVGLVIALATGLWSASTGFGHLIAALNIAYDQDEDRSIWKRRLIALGATCVFLTLVGVSVSLLVLAGSAGTPRILWLFLSWTLVGAMFGLFLAALYRYGPKREDPRWQVVSAGAMFAVVTWTLTSVAFGVYVVNFGSYNRTYGSLGAIVITLVWLYLTAAIVIVGAEINVEIERQASRTQ